MEKLTEVILLGMPSILQGRFPTLALILLGLSGILLVILARVALRGRSDEMRAFLNLWSCLLVGELFYYFYVALSDVEYTPYFIWYRSPSFIFWIVTGSLIASFVFVESRPLKSLRSSLRWAPAGVSLAIFAVAIYLFGRSIDFRSELYAARYEAALWIAEHSSPNTVFASWNAGQLGFFSDRTFINLDGVINNVDYYERVLVGSTTLADYLLENNVDYIVDYSVYGSIPDFQVVHQFPIDDGTERSIQIWKVRPQASLDQ